jgi:putative SOS response-associated peptidase YedK
MGVKEFYELFWRRAKEASAIDIPKAMEAAFVHPQGDTEREIKALIDEHAARQRSKLERLLFEQKTRLVQAERVLQHKLTKKAQNDRRVATDKVVWAHQKLADLSRTTLQPDDSRIFPRHYAPVLVMDKGQLMVMPMRYQCRPAGKPPSHDAQFPGTYNARRDSLDGYWSGLFGYRHGIVLASAFYEHVKRHRSEGRELAPGEVEEDVVLEFRPQHGGEMLVACLWSRWTGAGSRNCCRSRRSPTTRRRKSLQQDTTAASFPFGLRTWTRGSTPIRRTWRPRTPSSMTGSAPFTSTGSPPDAALHCTTRSVLRPLAMRKNRHASGSGGRLQAAGQKPPKPSASDFAQSA